MTAGEPLPILIAGGGIGGLAAALALARQGIASCVLERESFESEIGAGIQLGPSATRILRSWGLGDALAVIACHPERIDIFDSLAGKRLNFAPLDETALHRYGAPYCTLYRVDLRRLLLDAVQAEPLARLVPGFKVEKVASTADGVAAISAEGETIEGEALVGADGIHSTVRGVIAEQTRPAGRGASAWRLIMPADDAPLPFRENAVSLWLHPKGHLVHYPIAAGRLINVVVITASGHGVSPPSFQGWLETVRAWLEGRTDWLNWPLLEMQPLPVWSRGRVTLLGDAAHPVLPFLASGGVLAIEDAATLAKEMAKMPGDPAAAFQRYEAARRKRVLQVTQQSRRMGEIYHLTGLPRLARNLVLSALPRRLLMVRNDWLYRYSPDGAA